MAKTSLPIPETLIPLLAFKGRGAVGNLAHRFSLDQREQYDDGWDTLELQAAQTEEKLPPQTQIIPENAKSAISKNDSPDLPFDYGLNPYRGCEHGCIYCYARPSHSYLNLSPALDFETKIIAKMNIAEVLRSDLSKKSYLPKLINIGSATDCYQPIERELKLTRGVIEVLSQFNHPFALVTKSALVERDLDFIAPMAAKNLAAVYVTITTLDSKLARILEPRAAAPYRRLKLIESLVKNGVPTGVSVSPQIPFINEDMEQVLQAAAEAGAKRAFYSVVRLPWELAPMFKQWLTQHYPDRAERVMARIREMRGGQDYDANFSTRMKGQGLWAELIAKRFQAACQKWGYQHPRFDFDLSKFQAEKKQTELF